MITPEDPGPRTLATYTLQLISERSWHTARAIDAAVQFPALLRETEENLTDLLPEGYSVRIMEWDAEEGE